MVKHFFLLLILSLLSVQLQAQILTKRDFLNTSSTSHSFEQRSVSGLKSKALAQAISITATLSSYYFVVILSSNDSHSIPAYILASAFLITAPSAGFLYIRNPNEFWYGSGKRSISMGLMLVGLGLVALDNALPASNEYENTNETGEAALALMVGGLIGFFWSTITDIIDLRKETVRYNQRLIRKAQFSPVIDPVHKSVGIGFNIRW